MYVPYFKQLELEKLESMSANKDFLNTMFLSVKVVGSYLFPLLLSLYTYFSIFLTKENRNHY